MTTTNNILSTRRLRFISKCWCACLLLCMAAAPAFAQTQRIARLKMQWTVTANESGRTEALQQLCEQGHSLNIDSFFAYVQQFTTAAAASGDANKIILSHLFLENWLVRKNLLDSALRLCNADLQHAADGEVYEKVNRQQCFLLMKTNNRQEALAYTYHFLEAAEAKQDTLSQIYCKYIIGCVYRSMQQTDQALHWFLLAAHTGRDGIYDEIKNEFAVYLQAGGMYNWKAVADTTQQDVAADSARSMEFLDKTIAYSRQFENRAILARALCMKADALEDPVHLPMAESLLHEATGIYDQLHDTLSILNGLTAMADYYLSSGKADSGIACCQHAISVVSRGFTYPIGELYWTLAQCYRKSGNMAQYADVLNKLIAENDATYKKNSEKDLAELNARYEVSNKEAFIARQKLQLLQRDIWIAASLLFTLVVATVAILRFRNSRRAHAIALKDAEEKERRRIAADLHDNIGAYASAISAGIDEMENRKLVTDATSLQNLKSNVAEIMTSLRDTIWAFNKESIPLTALSDRTKTHIQKIKSSYPQVNMQIRETITAEKNLSPIRALHLFRIIQEALHNAVKHSGCTAILVQIDSDAENILVRIDDNGKGFDPDNCLLKGNGLANMKHRAEEAGFQLAFDSGSSGGAAIVLRSLAGSPA